MRINFKENFMEGVHYFMRRHKVGRARKSKNSHIYRELCPVSAVAIIGSGLVVLAMGDMMMGGTLIFSGFIVGAMAPQ